MYINLKTIFFRTKQLISSVHLPIQILILNILEESLKFVQFHEDSLLPMIHQNWHGLINKISPGWSCNEIANSQQLVAAKAITVIFLLFCGVFLLLKKNE